MSLNQLLVEGKTGEGLDLEVRSISTASGAGNLVRGSLTVLGISDLQGAVTCESSLDIVGSTNLFGSLSIDSKPVVLNGVQLRASQNLIATTELTNIGSTDFRYQRYGTDVLHISGTVFGDIVSTANSKTCAFVITVPNGYTLAGPFAAGRYCSVSGGGCLTTGIGTSLGQWGTGVCYPASSTTYRISFNTGTGANMANIAGQLMLSFSVWLDLVTG